jgi:hypothetical protein
LCSYTFWKSCEVIYNFRIQHFPEKIVLVVKIVLDPNLFQNRIFRLESFW